MSHTLVFQLFNVWAFLLPSQYNQVLARLSCRKDEFQQRETFVCGYRVALWEEKEKTKQNKNWLWQYILELLKAKHEAEFTCLPATA